MVTPPSFSLRPAKLETSLGPEIVTGPVALIVTPPLVPALKL